MAEGTVAAVPTSGIGGFFNRLNGMGKNNAAVLFAIGVLGILSSLIIPLPAGLLDVLLGISITFSLLILLNTIFIEKSLDFSSFPTVLLIAALLRLSLNVATTRIILSHGHEGTGAAGHVIETFGSLVIGGNIVIGAIVFIILTIINFIVITKGSGRIAEVSARFSLDAMPGKQMAIDADLSAGLIDENVAKLRRKELEEESSFFGAMDGASKFVRGDAIAGIIITFVNFAAGILIGVVQRDMPFAEAAHTYTTLTIGDGLVAQIPALIVSMSAGLLVTKAGVAGSADKAFFGQLSQHPQGIAVVSVVSFMTAMMPGMPMLIFLSIAAATGGGAWYLMRKEKTLEALDLKKTIGAKGAKGSPSAAGAGAAAGKDGEAVEEPIEKTMKIDSVRLELGYGLLPLINYTKGQKLTEQIKALRRQMAKDLGFVMPSIRIQDNMQLPANHYLIKIKEIECGRGDVRPDKLLVMDPRGAKIDLPGEDTKEPAFGLPAKWVSEGSREEALFRNYTVVPPPTVITTHITEIIKENIAELLSFAETQKLLDGMEAEHKKLVDEAIPTQITVSGVQRVLQNLLSEHISIRDLPTILEAIAEASKVTQNLTMITEHVRTRLNRQVSFANANEAGELTMVSLSPGWEQIFAESLAGKGEERQLAMPPSQMQEFIRAVREGYEKQAIQGQFPVLVTSPMVRPYVRAIIERFRPATTIMSQNEIHPKVKLRSLGMI
jgi:flagellar biosynthesis protein FlhA